MLNMKSKFPTNMAQKLFLEVARSSLEDDKQCSFKNFKRDVELIESFPEIFGHCSTNEMDSVLIRFRNFKNLT